MIVENFRARPARACVGHLPEIVGRIAGALVVADTNNAPGRNTDFLGPDIVSLIVFVIDGYPKFFCRQLIDSGQELPGIVDGIALEVIAKAEVREEEQKTELQSHKGISYA